jgi:two-component system chemotaxis response regulator CheY
MAENIIMAVDDSPTVTKFVSFTLRSGGFKVYTACDGMDALEKLSNIDGNVDLVITDLNMPNIDGYELIRTLKANDKYRDTPVIILSSEENEEDISRGKQAGASSYLIKPFKPDVLLTEVGKYLKAKQPV